MMAVPHDKVMSTVVNSQHVVATPYRAALKSAVLPALHVAVFRNDLEAVKSLLLLAWRGKLT